MKLVKKFYNLYIIIFMLLVLGCSSTSNNPLIIKINNTNTNNWDSHSQQRFEQLKNKVWVNKGLDNFILKNIALILLTHNEKSLAKELFIYLNKNSEGISSYYFLSEIYKNLNQYELAHQYIFNALKKATPTDKVIFYLLRVEILLEQGELESANNTILAALKIDSENSQAHYLLAKTSLLQNNCQLAITEFKWVLTREPHLKQLYTPLTMAYRACGEVEKANTYAKIRSPENIQFINRFNADKQQLGNPVKLLKNQIKLLNSRKDYHAAVNLLNKLITMEPNDADSFINLGSMNYFLTNYLAAEKAFLKAHKLNPKDVKPLINLGNVALQRNNLELGASYYQKAFAINSQHPKILLNLASIESQLSHYKKSEELFRLYLQINPNDDKVKTILKNMVQKYREKPHE